MKRLIAPTVLALFATVSLAGPGPVTPSLPTPAGGQPFEPVDGSANYAIVEVGTQAPDFSFDSQGRSLRLHDLRAQGHLLLVFAPDEARLVALERERPRLMALGVVPVVVLDRRAGSCAATVRRLGLGYSVIPDPRRVIGAQFNVLDPLSRADAPAWFVISRTARGPRWPRARSDCRLPTPSHLHRRAATDAVEPTPRARRGLPRRALARFAYTKGAPRFVAARPRAFVARWPRQAARAAAPPTWRTTDSTSSHENGFAITKSTPRALAASSSSWNPQPVTSTTVGSGRRSLAC